MVIFIAVLFLEGDYMLRVYDGENQTVVVLLLHVRVLNYQASTSKWQHNAPLDFKHSRLFWGFLKRGGGGYSL